MKIVLYMLRSKKSQCCTKAQKQRKGLNPRENKAFGLPMKEKKGRGLNPLRVY